MSILKDKFNTLMDYIVGKVVDIVLAKVQAGQFDALITQKVDAVIAEIIVPPAVG